MVAANLAPVVTATPVAANSSANQANARQTDPSSDQPSFAQVLKSHSREETKSTQGSTKNEAQKAQQETSANRETATDGAQTPNEGTPQTSAPLDQARLLLGKISPLTGSSSQDGEDTATTDPTALVLQPDPAAAAAALAASAASLAGNTSQTPTTTDGKVNQTVDSGGDNLSFKSAATEQFDDQVTTKAKGLGETTTKETSLGAQTKEAQNSFATELANAGRNLETSSLNSHGIANASTAARSSEPLPQHEVSTPVASRGWAEEVGQKVSWIASKDSGRAELVLTPPQLGRIEVTINMNGDQASATFVAASSAARDALQDAMPRLREVLADAGIQLGQASVNAGNSGQAQADTSARSSFAGRFNSQNEAGISVDTSLLSSRGSWTRQGNGMVDTFA